MKSNRFLKAPVFILWLALFTTAHAQDPKAGETKEPDLPTLQEWWRTEFEPTEGGGISYLPNFKDGHGALAITTADGDKTWMLKFPGDTANVFTWQTNGAKKIQTGDFNGDGITDYLDALGNIYRGIQNGQPPEPEFINYPSAAHYVERRTIVDINNDGFDDIVLAGYMESPHIISFILGGSDIKNLRIASKTKNKLYQYYDEDVTGIYRAPDNTWRVLAYWDNFTLKFSNKPGDGGFVLYKMDVVPEGESVQIKMTELDRTTEHSSDGKQIYDPFLSKVYKSSHSDKASLIALSPDYKIQTVFTLANEQIEFKHNFFKNIGRIIPSIDGDSHEDYLNSYNGSIAVFSGGDKLDTTPITKISTCSFNYVTGAGDINGDGIGDLAFIHYGNPSANIKGCFSIVLGQTPTSVNDYESTSGFFLEESIPHPVSLHSTAILPVNINTSGMYSLEMFNLKGQKVAGIFNGVLDSGKQNLPLNIAAYHISSGTYTLRLSNGKASREQTIIITE